MGGRKKKKTGAYKYFLGMHMILCHGPIDRITRIQVDERTAAEGDFADEQLLIVKPDLFGGKKREGGIDGFVDIEMGGPTQSQNSYLLARLGSLVPAFRGVVGVVLRQMFLGQNPYLKPWQFRAQRIHVRQDDQAQWYDEKAAIGFGNEVLYEDLALNAVTNCSPTHDPSIGITISGLSAHDVLIVDKPTGLTYQAWSFWSSDDDPNANGKPWQNRFRVTGDLGTEEDTTIYAATRYETAEEAEANFPTVVLRGNTQYSFWLKDEPVEDNRGGLSVRVTKLGHLDMNPAHIIRECLTDPDWGMSYQETDPDDTAFTAAADTLFGEGMGISLLWDRQTAIEDFVQDIVRHIDAAMYVDRTTGQFVLKLIRDDYDVGSLITLGPSEIDRVEDYARPAPGELVNSVTVNYWDAATGRTGSLTAQDTAMIQHLGVVIDTTIDYPGFTNETIAARVAARDLRQFSNPLLSCTIYANRTAADLNIGDAFLFDWPDLHDTPIIMRVTELAFGDGRNNMVRIRATEDAFSLDDNAVIVAPTEEWTDPSQVPGAAQKRIVVEAPYYEVVQQLGQTVVDQNLADNPELGYMLASAQRPEGAINATLLIDDGSGYEDSGIVEFSPAAETAAIVKPGQTVIPIQNGTDLDLVETGTHCQMGEELCRVDAVSDSEVTLGRGILDTVPAEHPAGTAIVFWDDYAESDETEYAAGESLNVKLLSASGAGVLAEADAPVDSLTIDQRASRPYPPGNLQINGSAYPESIGGSAALALTWSHRDRLQQTSGTFEDTTEGDIGPEAGVTYTLRIYGEDDTLGRTEAGIAGTSYTYTTDDERNDFEIEGEGSDPWTPEQVDTLLWLDADDADTITLNSGVSAWEDKSGLGITAQQSTADDRPSYVNEAINGRSVVRFDGTSDHLVISTSPPFPTGAGTYVLFAVMAASSDDFRGIYSAGNFGTANEAFMFRLRETWALNDGWWSNNLITANNAVAQSQAHLVATAFDGTGREIFVDGSSVATDSETAKNTGSGDNLIAATKSQTQVVEQFFHGDMCEIILMDAATEEDRQLIEGYLAHKWGFASALPSSHPYKASAPTFSFRLNGRLRIELESRRGADATAEGDLVSFQHHDYTVLREGYGFNYGELYGGSA